MKSEPEEFIVMSEDAYIGNRSPRQVDTQFGYAYLQACKLANSQGKNFVVLKKIEVASPLVQGLPTPLPQSTETVKQQLEKASRKPIAKRKL